MLLLALDGINIYSALRSLQGNHLLNLYELKHPKQTNKQTQKHQMHLAGGTELDKVILLHSTPQK